MDFKRLYTLILENDELPFVLIKHNDDDAEDYYERYNNFKLQMISEFIAGREKVSWSTIKAPRLKKIWLDFGRIGFVRDEKGLNNIKEIMLNNIVKLDLCTMFVGHSHEDPQIEIDQELEETGDKIDLTDEKTAEKWYWNFFETPSGIEILSDYGLPKLKELYPSIHRAENSEQLLYAIDKALNVVHQRNDLAAMFIEGGRQTLQEIMTQQ